eukprot:1160118-Pelagomonas_calceolata.AAC.1
MALRFLRSMLGVRTSAPFWSVLRKCRIKPVKFNWFRACARFIILSPIATIARFMILSPIAIIQLQVARFIILSPIATVVTALYFKRCRHLAYWRQFSGYDPRDTNSKKSTFHNCLDLNLKGELKGFFGVTVKRVIGYKYHDHSFRTCTDLQRYVYMSSKYVQIYCQRHAIDHQSILKQPPQDLPLCSRAFLFFALRLAGRCHLAVQQAHLSFPSCSLDPASKKRKGTGV